MKPLVISLPWPPSACSPNARGHWSRKAKAAKAYRTECAWQAAAQGARELGSDVRPDGRLHVHVLIVMPDKRARDMDNALAAAKSGLDGVASVIGVDDSRWVLTLERAPVIGGFIRLTIREYDEAVFQAVRSAMA